MDYTQQSLIRLGTKVRVAKKALGFTNTDISFQLGVSPSTLIKIEGGENVPMEQLIKVVEFLGLRDDLIDLFSPRPIYIDDNPTT
ncbi:MAG: helix-turn-helix transcriptional regulator [Betaproteobacteria bacterium]|jgi:transcriptional regulator with XRE-family HTH domain